MAEKGASANWVLLILLFAIAGATMGMPLCNVDTSQFSQCYPAVTGNPPSPPTLGCCRVVRKANIPCLCGYKGYLRMYGIDPARVFALPGKCGIKVRPPC